MTGLTKGIGMKFYLLIGAVILAAAMQVGFDWGKPVEKPKAAQSAKAGAAPSTTTVDIPFPQMMGALSQNMTLWPTLSEENKTRAVEASILVYRTRDNAAILKSADFYAGQVDQAMQANPALQGSNLMTIIRILAVMEYDFYNGQNKDELAKETLGEKMYQAIRARKIGR